MGYQACITAIQKAAGEALSEDDVEAILSDIVARRRARAGLDPLQGDTDAFAAAAKQLSDEEKTAAIIEKRNRILNIQARSKRFSFYNSAGGGGAERIQSAAIRLNGQIFTGLHHAEAAEAAAKATGELVDDLFNRNFESDGFITSAGRYVTRAEAAEIAVKADQIEPIGDMTRSESAGLVGRTKELFAEQLDGGTTPGQTASFANEAQALSALNVGSEKQRPGAAFSVDAQQRFLEDKLTGGLVAELRKSGALEALKARDATFDRDVAREMWRLSGGGGEATGNKFALQAAEILVKYQEAARVMQNKAGAAIGKLPGYVVRQSHDQASIYWAGHGAKSLKRDADLAFRTWRDDILPLLDERTFDGVADRDKMLRRIYTDFATGNHLKSEGAADWLGGFKGPGNLAKKVSQERSLHFKDANAWYDYNAKYGASSLLEAAFHGLQRSARNTALMRTWGTNPEAAFNADLDRLVLRAKERGDAKAVSKLSGWLPKAEFDQLTGAANIAKSPRLATIAGNIRSLESLSSLGGVVLSSITDTAVNAAVMRHNGVNLLEGYGSSLKSIFEGRTKGETREIADLLGVGFDGMMGSVLNRFSSDDSTRGILSRMVNRFFDLNLLNWWTDSHEASIGLMLSHNLARNTGKAFDQLDPLLRGTFSRFGIETKEWDAIRQSGIKQADGRTYLTPDAIQYLPDDKLGGLSRDDLELKLGTYLSEQSAEAMTFAGARERAITNFGQQRGTPLGEAIRFIMQFKTFPITFVTRHLTREARRGGVTGVVHLIVASTVLGYLAQSAKEVVKGRSPRDPTNYKTWLSAMQQGGGAGIYGDFLFGEANRFGGGPIETAAGPAASTAADILGIINLSRDALFDKKTDAHDVGAQALRAAVGNMPFANLFYTRAALDYLFLYQIQETLNPGYLRRFEQRVQRENGQTFILRPSDAVPRGGGSRAFEGVR